MQSQHWERIDLSDKQYKRSYLLALFFHPHNQCKVLRQCQTIARPRNSCKSTRWPQQDPDFVIPSNQRTLAVSWERIVLCRTSCMWLKLHSIGLGTFLHCRQDNFDPTQRRLVQLRKIYTERRLANRTLGTFLWHSHHTRLMCW